MQREPGFTPIPKNLPFRVGMLIGMTVFIAVGFVAYVLYARGVFEDQQHLTLVAENAEGISVGMDLTFAGFPIGSVHRISLGEDGRARISIDIPRKDARWLRTTSVFTLERGVVGGARLRAYSSDLNAPPLEDGAVRQILRGDTTEEIPQMVATLRGILENLDRLTGPGGTLQAIFSDIHILTGRMAGKHGVLGGMLGSEQDAGKVIEAINRTNTLLASLASVSSRLDSMASRADQRVLGEGGVVEETQKALTQAQAILGDVRESLKKLDAVLGDAQAVSANAKAATTDLVRLRAEVDESVRKVGRLIDEINRKWPFKREAEMPLP